MIRYRLTRVTPALVLALVACNSAPDRPDKDPPPRPPASTLASTPGSATPPAASGSASGSAPGPASATAPQGEASSLAGTWEGSYDAKKASVSLPPKVKDKGLAGDNGKTAVGAGSIELFIGQNGEVRGKGRGALGACTLTGRAEEGMVRATLMPDDPRAEGAMTGVLVGALKGDAIHGELHVAGPDATLVREATIELKKK